MRCLVRAEPGKARCRFHGGLSTGPRTEAGRARIADAQRRRGRAYREKLQAILDQGVCRESPSRIGSSSPRARENFSAISSSLRTSGTRTSRASPGRHGTRRRCGRFRLKAASRRCTRPARPPSSDGKKNPNCCCGAGPERKIVKAGPCYSGEAGIGKSRSWKRTQVIQVQPLSECTQRRGAWPRRTAGASASRPTRQQVAPQSEYRSCRKANPQVRARRVGPLLSVRAQDEIQARFGSVLSRRVP